jgi:hypothetical protein
MSGSVDVLSKLTYTQMRELRLLASDPDARVGSCTNSTMKALRRRGLVDIEWTSRPGSLWRDEKWVVTEAAIAALANVGSAS